MARGYKTGGRKKGAKNKLTIERETAALIDAGRSGDELPLDVINRAMKLAEGIVSFNQPKPVRDAEKNVIGVEGGDWVKFGEWFDRWTFCAALRAKYIHPQLRAVVVSMPGEQRPSAQTIEAQREPVDATERVERASRAYLTLIRGGRSSAA